MPSPDKPIYTAEKEPLPFENMKILLTGPSKRLLVYLRIINGNLNMQDSIENTTSKKPVGFPETRAIYLEAIKKALEIANKLKIGFNWQFNASDPEHKMQAWLETNRDWIKLEIPFSEVFQELTKIQKLLEGVAKNHEISVLAWKNISAREIKALKPGQKLFFDESKEGKNLGVIHGNPVEFLSSEEPNYTNALPLLTVEGLQNKIKISPYYIKSPVQ